ncbi:PREDICTED: uncharacterized protein LOC106812270 [Priapulus caudatus]|uniref:Uncharacterized protein LOC106812270 n=1 Tax=Priapulus caudatus TaxID=37621 RepID=A0ABM1EHB6_PRICU|nr:PREDICTED: uncharacterized protein LOC106812270 [Priapulus caudatus]
MQEHSSLVATPTKSRVDASGPETRAAILHDVIAPQEIMFPNTFIGGVGELSWSIVDMRAAAAVAAEANVAVQLFPLEPTYMMVGAGPMQPSSSMVFHVAKSAWTVQYGGTTTVPVRFTPMNAGRYHQIWKVELSLGTRTEVRTLRIYGDGTKRAIPTTASSGYKPVTARQQELDFGSVDLGSTSKLKLQICNKTDCNYALNVALPSPPFNVSDKNKHVSLKSHHFVSLPIYFRPNRTGVYCHTLTIDVQDQDSLSVQLKGECKIH